MIKDAKEFGVVSRNILQVEVSSACANPLTTLLDSLFDYLIGESFESCTFYWKRVCRRLLDVLGMQRGRCGSHFEISRLFNIQMEGW
jgi:hypothetical protein